MSSHRPGGKMRQIYNTQPYRATDIMSTLNMWGMGGGLLNSFQKLKNIFLVKHPYCHLSPYSANLTPMSPISPYPHNKGKKKKGREKEKLTF